MRSGILITLIATCAFAAQPANATMWANRINISDYSPPANPHGWTMMAKVVEFNVNIIGYANVSMWAEPFYGSTTYGEVGYRNGWDSFAQWTSGSKFYYGFSTNNSGTVIYGSNLPSDQTYYRFWIYHESPSNQKLWFALQTTTDYLVIEQHDWWGRSCDIGVINAGLEAYDGSRTFDNSNIPIGYTAWWPWNDWNIYYPNVLGIDVRYPNDSSNPYYVGQYDYGWGASHGIHIWR